jgi:hypothetical protein
MSACPTVSMEQLTEQTLMKFDILVFLEKSVKKIQV